jgi:phage shock protein A
MGIFSRITEIINSNINAMLDKAEDPEKMVKLMIHEMEDTLTEVKSAAAEVVADKIRLSRQIQSETNRQLDWDGKAKLALDKDREDLAREAIEQKLACEKKLHHLKERIVEVEGHVKQYQSDISRLEEKLNNARNRQRTLIANHQSAMNRKRVEEKIYKVNTSGAFARFDNYENRIDRWQAEADIIHTSNNTLEQKFEDLAQGKDVEDELAKLKASLGKSTPKGKAAKEPVEIAN